MIPNSKDMALIPYYLEIREIIYHCTDVADPWNTDIIQLQVSYSAIEKEYAESFLNDGTLGQPEFIL